MIKRLKNYIVGTIEEKAQGSWMKDMVLLESWIDLNVFNIVKCYLNCKTKIINCTSIILLR